ncbi:M56 family metallopeptidase [Nocardia africana]|uniref:Heat shock protein HtpX n=1 Tax=Nocardia africana TaxID=134964 RepID=A0A378X1L1_9NOCA|nr:M56 family metallopeptidase [Nocardia africana]SUA47490.1 heat shock protein HtpX [Nocardia africana]
MSSAVCLLLYGFVVAVLAPSVLRRYTRDGIAPRLGLTAWLCAIVSVAVSWAAAIVVIVVDIAHDMSHPGETSILDSCLLQLHDAATGQYGAVIQVALLSLAAMATVAGGFLLARLTAGLLRARSVTHDHARMARVIGRHNSRLDVFVIDLDEPMAYCVAGKPDTVVVTQGVVEALDDAHLQAVLAHERAHLAGRHHVLLALTRGLAGLFPRIQLFRAGAVEVAQLAEMCADDVAARSHGNRTVTSALLVLSGAGERAGALGAAGTNVAARVERLTTNVRPQRRWATRLKLSAATTFATVGPLVAMVMSAVGLAVCTADEDQATALGSHIVAVALHQLGCDDHHPHAQPHTYSAIARTVSRPSH